MDKTGILKELQKIHEKLQDLGTVKESIAQLEKKIDTTASQNATIQSAQIRVAATCCLIVSLQSLQYVTNLNTPGSLQRSEAY
jgi:hypothetical protein